MFTLLIVIHISLCVVLVSLVLLQQGKGADMGAAFGGGANTIFGAGGGTQMIVKITTGVAIAFMISSVFLIKTYKAGMSTFTTRQQIEQSVLEGSRVKEVAEGMKKDSVPEESAVKPLAPQAQAPAVNQNPVQENQEKKEEPVEVAPAVDPKPVN